MQTGAARYVDVDQAARDGRQRRPQHQRRLRQISRPRHCTPVRTEELATAFVNRRTRVNRPRERTGESITGVVPANRCRTGCTGGSLYASIHRVMWHGRPPGRTLPARAPYPWYKPCFIMNNCPAYHNIRSKVIVPLIKTIYTKKLDLDGYHLMFFVRTTDDLFVATEAV